MSLDASSLQPSSSGLGGSSTMIALTAGIIAPALESMTANDPVLAASTTQQGILTASLLFGAMIGSIYGISLSL
jgi:hypothetical protein